VLDLFLNIGQVLLKNFNWLPFTPLSRSGHLSGSSIPRTTVDYFFKRFALVEGVLDSKKAIPLR
jgi:hypothetical protein